MVDHSEFPWGPEAVPGMLTPLGVAGWIVAGVLALVLMNALRQGGETRRVVGAAILETIYDLILGAARYALRQSDFGILSGADVLRRTVRGLLGGVLLAGGGLQKHLKKLGEVLGEKDEKKGDDKKKDAHGAGHGKHEAHPVAAEPAAASVSTETVHGHSITLNIGTEVAEKPGGGHGGGHGGDDGHGDDHEKPPTLEEQLVLARKAVREFEAWWSDKPARMAELLAARDDLTTSRKLDPALVALIEEKKAH